MWGLLYALAVIREDNGKRNRFIYGNLQNNNCTNFYNNKNIFTIFAVIIFGAEPRAAR